MPAFVPITLHGTSNVILSLNTINCNIVVTLHHWWANFLSRPRSPFQ